MKMHLEYLGTTGFINRGLAKVYFTTRGGTKSPKSIYIYYKGRWISPFEQRVRKWIYRDNVFLLRCFGKLFYKNQPVQEVLWVNNAMLDEIKWIETRVSKKPVSISAALPKIYWRKFSK